ncbi:hypothetical protein V1279_002972 [Bradyrhizobium sp. AZCC 1610]|uniref:hypothetical protein n=1 Tax=Bradyrhizobium sp. AZCC 1610 TaxID=3117020 RepID=UPI002FF21165
MSFFLVTLEPDGKGNMVDVPIPDYGPYDKGSDAAKHAKVLTEKLGRKVQPRRIAQAADWRARQAQRLADGTLKPLPAKWDVKPIKDHFAHLHADDVTNIAFTENDELGVIDRVTILTAGRYLSRFYPDLDNDKRNKLIAAIDPSGEVYYATTPEEITRIYKEGPSSCMDGSKNFNLPVWPTAPYGAGDLAVAYQVNARGRIQSRCVCWPAKKQFGRVFGDFQRMRASMESEGFTYIRTDNSVDGNSSSECFDGARLLKIPTGRVEHEYVMPYFDDIKFALDMGDHFVTALEKPEGKLGASYITTGSTAGKSDMYRWCPKLKNFHPASHFRHVHGVNEEWCQEAINIHGAQCEVTGELWPYSFLVERDDGSLVSPNCAEGDKPKAKTKKRGRPPRAPRISGTHADLVIIDDPIIRAADWGDAIEYCPIEPNININVGDQFDAHAFNRHVSATLENVVIDREAMMDFLRSPSLTETIQQQHIDRMTRQIDEAIEVQVVGDPFVRRIRAA